MSSASHDSRGDGVTPSINESSHFQQFRAIIQNSPLEKDLLRLRARIVEEICATFERRLAEQSPHVRAEFSEDFQQIVQESDEALSDFAEGLKKPLESLKVFESECHDNLRDYKNSVVTTALSNGSLSELLCSDISPTAIADISTLALINHPNQRIHSTVALIKTECDTPSALAQCNEYGYPSYWCREEKIKLNDKKTLTEAVDKGLSNRILSIEAEPQVITEELEDLCPDLIKRHPEMRFALAPLLIGQEEPVGCFVFTYTTLHAYRDKIPKNIIKHLHTVRQATTDAFHRRWRILEIENEDGQIS